MGTYTTLRLDFAIATDDAKHDFAREAIAWMMDPTNREGPRLKLNHPLEHTERWYWMLNSGEDLLSGGTSHRLAVECDVCDCVRYSLGLAIKNYTEEWEQFLRFLAPHIDRVCGDIPLFIGTKQYENDDHPTLLYASPGVIKAWREGTLIAEYK